MLLPPQACRSRLWIMTGTNMWKDKICKQVSIAPLVTFRIGFGLLMFFSTLRFWWRGWISAVYLQPKFHFAYMGFEWVKPLGATGMYLLFGIIAASALCIAMGLFYRAAAVLFFIAFTYVELIDVTTYLNHYYFISLVAFILIWVPAGSDYSLDVLRKPERRRQFVPAWTIGIIRFQLALVYFFAGLAKVNSDWLIDAQPMRTWLPGKSHLPLIGHLMYKTWMAYLFAWFGAIYDLFIVLFLLQRKTRSWAYAVVLVFHVATAIFFPGIGMFPYVMIVSSLIFFSGEFHQRIQSFFPAAAVFNRIPSQDKGWKRSPLVVAGLTIYILIQLIVPMRFLFYPDHLFWNEEGYRYSWRVMLMEKSGATFFKVTDRKTGHQQDINNAAFLTPLQEKMMSTQPDLILRYAHYLKQEYTKKGMTDPEISAEIYVSLNGARSRLFIDSTVNLADQPLSWKHYQWILPYKQ